MDNLSEHEYMKIQMSIIPKEIISKYKLHKYIDDNGDV